MLRLAGQRAHLLVDANAALRLALGGPRQDGVVDASVTTIAGAKRSHDGHRKPDLLA